METPLLYVRPLGASDGNDTLSVTTFSLPRATGADAEALAEAVRARRADGAQPRTIDAQPLALALLGEAAALFTGDPVTHLRAWAGGGPVADGAGSTGAAPEVAALLYAPRAVCTRTQQRTQATLVRALARATRAAFNARVLEARRDKVGVLGAAHACNARHAAALRALGELAATLPPLPSPGWAAGGAEPSRAGGGAGSASASGATGAPVAAGATRVVHHTGPLQQQQQQQHQQQGRHQLGSSSGCGIGATLSALPPTEEGQQQQQCGAPRAGAGGAAAPLRTDDPAAHLWRHTLSLTPRDSDPAQQQQQHTLLSGPQLARGVVCLVDPCLAPDEVPDAALAALGLGQGPAASGCAAGLAARSAARAPLSPAACGAAEPAAAALSRAVRPAPACLRALEDMMGGVADAKPERVVLAEAVAALWQPWMHPFVPLRLLPHVPALGGAAGSPGAAAACSRSTPAASDAAREREADEARLTGAQRSALSALLRQLTALADASAQWRHALLAEATRLADEARGLACAFDERLAALAADQRDTAFVLRAWELYAAQLELRATAARPADEAEPAAPTAPPPPPAFVAWLRLGTDEVLGGSDVEGPPPTDGGGAATTTSSGRSGGGNEPGSEEGDEEAAEDGSCRPGALLLRPRGLPPCRYDSCALVPVAAVTRVNRDIRARGATTVALLERVKACVGQTLLLEWEVCAAAAAAADAGEWLHDLKLMRAMGPVGEWVKQQAVEAGAVYGARPTTAAPASAAAAGRRRPPPPRGVGAGGSTAAGGTAVAAAAPRRGGREAEAEQLEASIETWRARVADAAAELQRATAAAAAVAVAAAAAGAAAVESGAACTLATDARTRYAAIRAAELQRATARLAADAAQREAALAHREAERSFPQLPRARPTDQV